MFEDLTEQIEDKLKDKCVVLFVTDMCPKCKQMYNTISNATDSIKEIEQMMKSKKYV